jgi:hypothetical protein
VENESQAQSSKKRRKRYEWERHLVFAKTGGICFYCWDKLDFLYDFVCDHFVPLSKGGADDHSNLVPSCYFCDNRKRSFLPTVILCTTLKKWKHGELIPKAYLDLPAAISNEKLTRHQRSQIRRYKRSWEAQAARESQRRRFSEYARRDDSSTTKGTSGDAPGQPGRDETRGLHEGRPDDGAFGCAQPAANGGPG